MLFRSLGSKAQQEQAQKIATARALSDLKLQAAASSVYILSTLVGQVDAKLGRDIATVGNASIQVASAVSKFTQTAAALGGLGKALGSVVLTGDIFGAALQIFNMFGSSGPSSDEIILGQLQKLREELHQIRVEMHERFDRVDQALTVMA